MRNMIHLSNLPVLRAVADGPGQTENKTFQLSGQWLPQIREFRSELPAMQMFYPLFKVNDGGCTDTGIRCTHAENRRHGMWVDGNGNRRKPGSEASVGCNEVKTWPTWPVRHSHTRGRIL